MTILGAIGSQIREKLINLRSQITSDYQAADKVLDEKIKQTNTDLNTEKTDRIQSDNELQAAIDNEKKERQDADTDFSNQLEDTNNKILAEELERKDQDAYLNNKVDAEIQDRKLADSTIQNNLDLEKQTRESNDNVLDNKIKDLKEYSDNTFLNKLTTENQSIASEIIEVQNLKVKGQITVSGVGVTKLSETVKIEDNIIELNSNVDVNDIPTEDAGIEVNRGQEGKLNILLWNEVNKTLIGPRKNPATGDIVSDSFVFQSDLNLVQDIISGEISTRETQVQQLSSRIDQEEENRTQKDEQILAALQNEKEIREAKDNAIQASLDEEKATREDKDNWLLGNLHDEIQSRTEGDLQLQEDLANEENRAKASEAAIRDDLMTAITSESSRATAAEGDLVFNDTVITDDGTPAENLTEAVNALDRRINYLYEKCIDSNGNVLPHPTTTDQEDKQNNKIQQLIDVANLLNIEIQDIKTQLNNLDKNQDGLVDADVIDPNAGASLNEQAILDALDQLYNS